MSYFFTPKNLNRLVDLKAYSFEQTDSGGSNLVLQESILGVWAEVLQQSGGSALNLGQIQSFADYKITIRYRAQITENWTVVYEGQNLQIKRIEEDNTAYKRYQTLYCTVSKSQESWS